VRAVTWTPDGEALASGGDAGVVHVCEVSTGKVKASLTGHASKIWSIACSKDGLMLATASKDQTAWPCPLSPSPRAATRPHQCSHTSWSARCRLPAPWRPPLDVCSAWRMHRYACGASATGVRWLCCAGTPTRSTR